MTPRILLTGKNGQIGSDFCRLLPVLGIFAFDRSRLDLADLRAVRRTVQEVRPDLIVNTAAYNAVDRAESESSAAHAVNADAPAVLAEECRKLGAAIVHYSTDYVFDGAKRTPYLETDAPAPAGVYGKSKLAGELAIRASGVPHLIFRTAWVYAPQGRNFLLTVLRLATERHELRVVNDQIGAPTWSREVADATIRILHPFAAERFRSAAFAGVSGTYHMTAAGEASWYQFAAAILEETSSHRPAPPWLVAAAGGQPIVASRVLPITTAEYPTPARRPPYSVLSNDRLRQTFGVQLPHWRDQLRKAFESGE